MKNFNLKYTLCWLFGVLCGILIMIQRPYVLRGTHIKALSRYDIGIRVTADGIVMRCFYEDEAKNKVK